MGFTRLYIMLTKQVISQHNLSRDHENSYQNYANASFKRLNPHVNLGPHRSLDKKFKTQANEESYDQQYMEKQAKTGLFEESEYKSHKQSSNCYTKANGSSQSKGLLLQNDEKITAFEDIIETNEFQATGFVRKNTDSTTKSKRLTRFDKRTLVTNQQVFWNKKKHQPTLVLRPAILNPVIELELSKAQTILLNSPLAKNAILNSFEKKKNFQFMIKDFARKTRGIYINEAQRSDSTKQKNKKVITLSKRLARIRSKSTHVIEHQTGKNFLCNQIQRMAQKCEFDLQIKCLNTVKEEIQNRRDEIFRHNQDLKEQIKHLIIRENKLGDKKLSEVLLNDTSFGCEGQGLDHRADEERRSRLKSIQDRSKSCIVTTFKGPQNKKLKITNILGKIAKFKSNQHDKRKLSSEKWPQERLEENIQLVKYQAKAESKQQRESEGQILKVQQQFSEQEARRSLIKSIKTFCCNKNGQRLPFMNNMIKKIDQQ